MEAAKRRNRHFDKELDTGAYTDLRYYSKKAMKHKYPKGGYIVIGAIGEGLKTSAGTFAYEEEMLPYYTMHYNKLCYRVDGYVPSGEDTFLAVIKNCTLRRLLYVLICIAVITAFVIGMKKLAPKDLLDSDAKDFTPSTKMQVNTDPEHIAIPGYDEIVMEANTDTAYVALWNPPGNPCYFKFEIIMNDKSIYQSKLVAPGKAVTEIKLSEKISTGSHPAMIRIKTYSLEDQKSEMNGGEVNVTLVGKEKVKEKK